VNIYQKNNKKATKKEEQQKTAKKWKGEEVKRCHALFLLPDHSMFD